MLIQNYNSEEFQRDFLTYISKITGKSLEECSTGERYTALAAMILNAVADRRAATSLRHDENREKKVYYLSMEFLIGRLLENSLVNLGIRDTAEEALRELGVDIKDLFEFERDPGLGNGGLGRLAACFLDSIATLGLCGDGIGLNYHFGLFRQVFEERLQKAKPDKWLSDHSWLNKTDVSFDVSFGDKKVRSTMYDIDVIGYENGVNKLHLFDIDTVDEKLVKKGINFDKENIEKNLTLFLYPDDSDEAGNLLRIYQQYFMV